MTLENDSTINLNTMEYDEEEEFDTFVPTVEVVFSKEHTIAPYDMLLRSEEFFRQREKIVESKVEDKVVYTMTECLTAMEINNKREFEIPVTNLEKQLDSVLTDGDWVNASVLYDIIRDEWIKNGARGALTDWPGGYSEIGYGENVDYGKMHIFSLYNLTRVNTNNKHLYEMYAYMMSIEIMAGRKLIWTRHWRAFKYMLAFGSYSIVYHYQKILRMCEDRYFQQYINLVSLVYGWGLIFSYPYVEILKENRSSRTVRGTMVAMTPVMDPQGTGVNLGGMTRIGIKSESSVIHIDFDLKGVLPYLSASDFISVMLVSKTWYSAVDSFTAPFREYVKHLGKYAYGTGLERVAPIRRIHTYNGPYSGSYFGEQIYHETKGFCQRCLDGDDITGEMNEFSSEAQIDRYVLGYNVELFVDWSTVEWVVHVMENLPLEYRMLYDKMFCLTTGHFANIYDCCMRITDKNEQDMIDFYKKDYLFHMLLPFVPGALSWGWDKSYQVGQQWAFLNNPD